MFAGGNLKVQHTLAVSLLHLLVHHTVKTFYDSQGFKGRMPRRVSMVSMFYMWEGKAQVSVTEETELMKIL